MLLGKSTMIRNAKEQAAKANAIRQSSAVRLSGTSTVLVSVEELTFPTYLPAAPDTHPMFLEKRVYQGSSGKVYPLPCTDRIAEQPVDRKWKALWIENEYLKVLILPEIGGRIHAIIDKTNGYDLIYNQKVIKPALVGLAGPWASGGIEFNWPQHHRPATFLPASYDIQEHADGSRTIWCSEHDPMARMKGMHGICLHPGRAVVELKARAFNRTSSVQTFLWWANVATRVHEAYQSFFPPDVAWVADHARRSMSSYPLAKSVYYGVNYGDRARTGMPSAERPAKYIPPHCLNNSDSSKLPADIPQPAPNDLSFYANIPVPTSYMCVGSKEDFFGGYDYKFKAGIVHIASHHISPGKKQWTWGNHEFGYAWDRNLTDADESGEFAPYIEIMSGVYTDNQPDFSFLQPGETKSWSQYWYPIQQIGPANHANVEAALSLVLERARFKIGICVTRAYRNATIRLEHTNGSGRAEWKADLIPGKPFILDSKQPRKPWAVGETRLSVIDSSGNEIIAYAPKLLEKRETPQPATEPAAPSEMASSDELYLTGLHLDQYRHATRCPTLYWREALRRDPLDARCNNALGRWHLHRGEWDLAERHFRSAIQRLTCRNANPYDSEPFYNLGICLRHKLALQDSPPHGLFEDAYAAFYKATWSQQWAGASFHALAEMDCRRSNWATALDHVDRALRLNADNSRARNLKAIVLTKLHRKDEANQLLRDTLALDPLDWWARHLVGQPLECDLQVRLDLAHDFARAGLYAEAIEVLQTAKPKTSDLPDQSWGAMPLILYTRAWLQLKAGDLTSAKASLRAAQKESPDYCFPSRLEEIAVLQSAMRAVPRDPRATYYLGNLLYDRRRHQEAIDLWELSAKLNPRFSIVWRNLGIAWFNIARNPAKACKAYETALQIEPQSARLLFERDQLLKRLGKTAKTRLDHLLGSSRMQKSRLQLVRQRDDLSIELCALYNQTGRHDKALELVSSRRFQPWEGGEGGPLGQHVRSHLMLGRKALANGKAQVALEHFTKAAETPENLGEARHLLANHSDIHYWLGMAHHALGQNTEAHSHWAAAASFKGDFQQMSVRAFSEMTLYSALSMRQLGQRSDAEKLLLELLTYAQSLEKSEAKIDYFATSLPTMLLFEDDLQFRQATTALFMQAQAHHGLGDAKKARAILTAVRKRDPNHALAADLFASLSEP